MIRYEFEDKLEIKGNFIQILAELEGIARKVRESACEMLGEEDGMEMYNFALEMAALSEEERKKHADEEKADRLIQVIFCNTSGTRRDSADMKHTKI